MSSSQGLSTGQSLKDGDVPRRLIGLGWVSLGAGSLFVQLSAVAVIRVEAVLPYVIYLVLAVLTYVILWRRLHREIFWIYQWYALAVLVLYLAQYFTLPEFHGLSGGPGIGTDDTFYFLQVADSAPHDLWVRNRAGNTFPQLLRTLSFWPIDHPLDILFVNAAVACFIPLFTRELARLVTRSRSTARLAFWLSLVCPFLLINSAVLVRDGWTAALFAGALVCLLKGRLVYAAALGLLLSYVRLASGFQLFAAALGFALFFGADTRMGARTRILRFALIITVAIAATVVIAPVAVSFLAEKGLLASDLFREEIIYAYAQATGNETVLGAVVGSELWLRVPVSFAFFVAGPFLGVNLIVQDGVFIPRAFLSTVFAVLFITYFGFLVRGSLVAVQRREHRVLVAIGVLGLLVLAISQLSLVIRHKAMLMPLFYVGIAYGMRRSSSLGNAVGASASAALLGVQLIAALAGV